MKTLLWPSLFLFISLINFTHSHPAPQSQEPPKEGSRGAVASETDVCSRVGISLMQKGGNAADAMVGTVICVGTIAMYHSGIGGGGFMIIRRSEGQFEFVDFRETAPAKAFTGMYCADPQLSIYGGLASGVPGELRGLEYLHKKYGKLSWNETILPSVQLARHGFRVNEDHVKLFQIAQELAGRNFLTEDPTWALDFAPNGTLVGLGDIMYRKRFADTLETIANKGADAFYKGVLAEAMIKGLNNTNGIMTIADVKNYSIAIRQPAYSVYRGYKLWSTSAPSSGAVAQAVLKIVEGYDFVHNPVLTNINISTHALVEAMRFGYAMRAELGDPKFVDGIDAFQTSMVGDAAAAEIRSRISFEHTLNISDYDPRGLESLDTPGTSHISTADGSGLAISLTTTINLPFGSTVMIPETGVIMNNQMNDFSIPGSDNAFGYIPSPANYIKPGKRPLSSISATIVEDSNGKLYLIVGAAGGSRIISSTVQSIHNVLDLNDTPRSALARPRFHDQLVPNVCEVETSYNNGTVAFLRSLQHNVTYVEQALSAVQAVRLLENGTFEAAGEPRQLSSAGYVF